MAKLFPTARLTGGDSEIGLPIESLLRISLLARLPEATREKLKSYPGYMRLRRLRKGEVICRQGDEDCTAFYLLTELDLYWLRDEISRLLSGLNSSEDLPPLSTRDREDVEQSLAQIPGEREPRLQASYEALKELQRRKAQALEHLEQLKMAQAERNQQYQEVLDKVAKSGDKEKLRALQQLRSAAASKKRTHAAQVERSEPALAELLRQLAEGEEVVPVAQKSIDFFRPIGMRKDEVKAIAAKDPALAQLIETIAAGDEDSPVNADVYLMVAQKSAATQERSWWQRLLPSWPRRSELNPDAPLYIPSDSPEDIDYRTRKATIKAGEVFGEMACLDRRPRAATVVAARNTFVLEMLSNILDEVDKDPGYQKERREIYKQRIVDLHLRELSIFRELTDEEFGDHVKEIRHQIELVTIASGQIICDEHERSDCMYLIREGIVQVKKNVSSLLSVADVLNWPELGKALLAEQGMATAVCRLLPRETQALLRAASDAAALSEADRREVVHGLNEVIKDRQLLHAAELKTLVDSAAFRSTISPMTVGARDQSELDARLIQRRLLEAALPAGALRVLPLVPRTEIIITYLSRGEFVGEMGLLEMQPRNATCMAFGQPRTHRDQKDLGRVELVRIPGAAFQNLIDRSARLRENLQRVALQRKQQNLQRLQKPTEDADQQLFSGEAARLGLIQGQQLMLIDLERCTRCNECVKACVDAHTDGNTRLFLTGPRFDKFLVPITCRSCLDPVCMIGCPVRAIQRGPNREMEIKDWCIGCEKCAKQCPYDSIQMYNLPVTAASPTQTPGANLVVADQRAVVCDLCSSVGAPGPRCVYACPHEAAFRVDAKTAFPKL